MSRRAPAEVLLVEDNPGDVLLTRKALQRAGCTHELRVAANGEVALDYLHKRGEFKDAATPDLVLLDVNLPRQSGHEVLRAIRGDEQLRRLPVVMLTSSESPLDIQEAYGNHVNTYFIKPDSIRALTSLMGSLDTYWFSFARRPSTG